MSKARGLENRGRGEGGGEKTFIPSGVVEFYTESGLENFEMESYIFTVNFLHLAWNYCNSCPFKITTERPTDGPTN